MNTDSTTFRGARVVDMKSENFKNDRRQNSSYLPPIVHVPPYFVWRSCVAQIYSECFWMSVDSKCKKSIALLQFSNKSQPVNNINNLWFHHFDWKSNIFVRNWTIIVDFALISKKKTVGEIEFSKELIQKYKKQWLYLFSFLKMTNSHSERLSMSGKNEYF